MLWLLVATMTYTVEPDTNKPNLVRPAETPRRKAGRVCPDEVKKPQNPKQEPKDVRTLPYCEPTPVPKPTKPPRRIER